MNPRFPTDQYTRNTVFTGSAQLVRLVVVLWLTPILISGLGLEGYGVWVLIFALVEYSEFLTFGIGTSFGRFIAEAHGAGDSQEVSRIVSTGLLFYLGISALIFLLWYLGLPLWKRVLEAVIEPGFQNEFLLILIAYILRNLGTPFRALINGLQRMEFTNAVLVIFQVAIAVGSIYALNRGGGIRELAIVWVACSALSLILLLIIGYALYPSLRIAPRNVSRKTFNGLRSFGIKVFAVSLAETGNRTLDKIILGVVPGAGGVAAAALYDVGMKLAGLLMMVPAAVIPPLVPAIATDPSPERRGLVLDKGLHLLGVLAIPGAIILIAHAPDIVAVWAGIEDVTTGGMVARILVAATLAFVISNLFSAVARGLGDPTAEMQYSIFKLGFNLVLGVIFALLFGLIGVAMATLISSILAYGGLLITLIRRFQLLSFRRLVTILLFWPGLIALCTAISGKVLFQGAGSGWSHLLPALFFEYGLTVLLLFATGYLKPLLPSRPSGSP
ncbi:MATE family efflux transporter [Candidatus Zixiibacteriota bacterium]